MNPKVSALAWALIHFLWEGGAIAALLAMALRMTKASRANLRYLLSCGAMVLMLASAAATFFWLSQDAVNRTGSPVSFATGDDPAPVITAQERPQKRSQFSSYLSSSLAWLVYLWMGGVLALSIRTGAGFVVAQRLKRRQASPLPPVWEERFLLLARRLQIARTIRACESAIADVPAVVGWLRPVVLVPASALMGLPAPDVEALLAHELAHIRRNDYLVNLLQTAVETLLFYHPAVWWTGRQIRAERENCCDDLAVAVCGDVLTYARALTRLEQMRAGAPEMAMAANRGSLVARIRRLVRPDDSVRNASGDWVTGVAILLSATAIYAAGYVPMPQAQVSKPAPVLVLAAAQKPEPLGPRVNADENDDAAAELQKRTQVLYDDLKSRNFEDRQASLVQRLALLQAQLAENESKSQSSLSKASALAQLSKELALLQTQVAQSGPASAASPSFIDGLAAEGYKSLTVDDLISFKIHGVTPEFVHRVKAAGFEPTPDELVSMRIHGVEPDQIAAFKAAGIDKLTIDDLVSFRIHGATPEFVTSIRDAGYAPISADDIISLRIHGVSREFAQEIKSLGLGNPKLDDLVTMRIHGVTADFGREVKALNLRGLDLDTLVELRIHGITPAFIREAQSRGFKDLSVDQVIRLRQLGLMNK